ncbi:AAA family ATPase [Actinoplanes sp. CA-030573]|uniref:helix-turn-helix transcriptional regulator n=1 Tax=Actinoplanes sp. CA-030573 TaxID=3239898 RepID=UPI003D91C8E9
MQHLIGRTDVLASLAAMIDNSHGGGAMILLGDAGIGKTTVLRAAVEYGREHGRIVLQAAGVEPEADLPFAGLHQLLRPVLDLVSVLPEAQRRALLTAFEMDDGPAPQPFLIALATLSLLSEAATQNPVIIAVDDAQWLDEPSHEVLAFVARRVDRDPIAIIATIRSGHVSPLLRTDVPITTLAGLADDAARELLTVHASDLDPSARSAILREASGNPLALVELPQAWRSPARPSTDSGRSFLPLTARLERTFAARLDDVPADTRDALLIAAVSDSDDLPEILAAAGVLSGVPVTLAAFEAAAAADLLSYDMRQLRFRHPLVRSGIAQQETPLRRQAAHAALAAVLGDQPYRRTWHQAQSIVGVDETVADALEDNHAIALRRGSVTSAIWALERSAQLTGDSGRRGRRLLLAAQHAFTLGRADLVDNLVSAAGNEQLTELDQARMEWLREIFNDGVPGDSMRVRELCGIAERSAAAGETDLTLNLLMAAALRCWWADAGAAARSGVIAVAERVAGRHPTVADDPRFVALLAVAEPVATAPRVRDLLAKVTLETTVDGDALRLYAMAAHAMGDPARMLDFASRAETKLRELGQLGLLSHVLTMQILDHLEVGDWERATACVEEGKRVAHDSGQLTWSTGTLSLNAMVAAAYGQYDHALTLAARAEQQANSRRLNDLLACVQLARGIAAVATGRYAEGFVELRRVFDRSDSAFHLAERYRAITFLAEAAAHCDRSAEAADVLDALDRELAGDFVPIVQIHLAYARAVLAGDDEAEQSYLRALAQDLVRWPWPKARLQLAYGSWLRRQRRIGESRAPLRAAQTTFDLMGATMWAEQARSELRAAGERTPADYQPAPHQVLSAQELQIARLAATGLSNREIGERLFLSPRTVGSHLYRIFPKLEITARGQLAARLQASS